MKWSKPPQELVEYFHRVIPDGPHPVTFRPMFGSPGYWTGGNMFAALHQDSMIVRLAEQDRLRLLKEPGAALFEPMPGRPMREYVVLPPHILEDERATREWLVRGLTYTASLPPREKEPGRRRTA